MRAYIADFGLATLTDSGSATTLTKGAVIGSLKWLAPELIPHAQVKRYHTYASDMYAFALVCYEASHIPFQLRIISNASVYRCVDVFRQNSIPRC
jgi:serine/threonine protein kinase